MKTKSIFILTTLTLLTRCVSEEERRADSLVMETERNSSAKMIADSGHIMNEAVAQMKHTNTAMHAMERSIKETIEQLKTTRIKLKTTLAAVNEMVNQTSQTLKSMRTNKASKSEKARILGQMHRMLLDMKEKLKVMKGELDQTLNSMSQESTVQSKLEEELTDHMKELTPLLTNLDSLIAEVSNS